MREVRYRLPRELFDALHLSSLAHGGIGAGLAFVGYAPCCVRGHAQWLDGVERHLQAVGPSTPTVELLESFGIGIHANDSSFGSAGHSWHTRIPFERWCELVGVDVLEEPVNA